MASETIVLRGISKVSASAFVLGTAQLGMNYGRVNATGKPSRKEAVAMIRHAVAHGVAAIDTARAYGDAENLVGEALTANCGIRPTVITKLNLSGLGERASTAEIGARVDANIEESRRNLNSETLDAVLLHNWANREMWQNAAWQRLLELKWHGKIRALGASVYQPHEALSAFADPTVQHLQVPINVLDWRWRSVMDAASALRPDVVVHARSVLLQGILVHPAERWPNIPHFDGADCARKLRTLTRRFQRESTADLCIAYVRSLPWIAGVVVGCETFSQLEHVLKLFSQTELSPSEMSELEDSLPKPPEDFLNPAKWAQYAEKAAYAS